MDKHKKNSRYERLYAQIEKLIQGKNNLSSRLATALAVLHHKMPYYFWTGFYFLREGKLLVEQYQGSLACIELQKHKGVCWEAINKREPVVVPDVEAFAGHIACDTRSKSEIVIPIIDEQNSVVGVLDVDSSTLNSFDEIDERWLLKIVGLLFQ